MKTFQNKMKTVVMKHRPDREALRLSVKNRLASDGTEAVPCGRFPEWLHGLGVVAVVFAFVVGIIVGSTLISGQREPVVTGNPTTTDDGETTGETMPSENSVFGNMIQIYGNTSPDEKMEDGLSWDEVCMEIERGNVAWVTAEEIDFDAIHSVINVTPQSFYDITGYQFFRDQRYRHFLLIDNELRYLGNLWFSFPYTSPIVLKYGETYGMIVEWTFGSGFIHTNFGYYDFKTGKMEGLIGFSPFEPYRNYDFAIRILKEDVVGDLKAEVFARPHQDETAPWTATHHLFYSVDSNDWTVVPLEWYEERDTFREEEALSLTVSAEPVSPDSFTATDVQELLSRLEAYPLKRYPMFDTSGGMLGGKVNYTVTVQYRDGSAQTVTLAPGFLYTDTEIYGVDKEQYESFCAYFGEKIVFEPRVTEIRVRWDSPNEQRIDVTDSVMVAELYGLIQELEDGRTVGDGPRFWDRSLTVYTADNRSRTLYLYAENLYAWSDDVDENGGWRIYTADLSGLYAYLHHAFPQLDSKETDSGE